MKWASFLPGTFLMDKSHPFVTMLVISNIPLEDGGAAMTFLRFFRSGERDILNFPFGTSTMTFDDLMLVEDLE